MNVSLTPELEKIINFKVQSGLYNSASEVVREGIRLLQQRDEIRQMKLEALRRDIEEGVRASEEGRVKDGREVMAEIKERLMQRKQS
jgi:antitoxin ParD1/3/4